MTMGEREREGGGGGGGELLGIDLQVKYKWIEENISIILLKVSPWNSESIGERLQRKYEQIKKTQSRSVISVLKSMTKVHW